VATAIVNDTAVAKGFSGNGFYCQELSPGIGQVSFVKAHHLHD